MGNRFPDLSAFFLVDHREPPDIYNPSAAFDILL